MFTETSTHSPKFPNVHLIPRPSQERGKRDLGWLQAFYTFSISPESYYDPKLINFGSLRHINEDRIQSAKGFGLHSHREMEIFSYIVAGELEHQDSMKNVEIMKRGDVQMTSAGTGISHSEFNKNEQQQTHVIQVWILPSTANLTPKYYTRHFTDEEKKDTLRPIVAPLSAPSVVDERNGQGPAPIHAGVSVFASILSPGATVTHTYPANSVQRKAYILVIQTSGYNTGPATGARVKLNGGLELSEGDGVFATGGDGDKIEIENVGDRPGEILVFDIE